ncbi:hypothetical protein NHF40_12530 [Maricaulaceae bacterium EIL42A08]|nr:hypothetical protein [Maricaulaceae bacterium EIL42A08]
MKTCLECEESLLETAFSPRGYSPSGEVVKRAPRCRSCTTLIQNWDRERKRRLAWLEKKGLGPSAFEVSAARVGQQLPTEPPNARPMPTMPEDYFSQKAKRRSYGRRALTPEEEAAKVKREEKLKATEAYQIALKARQDREGIISGIEHCEWYLQYVEDHMAKWGTLHHCIENPTTGEISKAPWKVCTYGLERLRPETEERLAYLRAKLAAMPEVDLPSLPDPS